MNFFDLDFFISLCETGFYKACIDFSYDEKQAIKLLKDMQKYLGVNLFFWDDIPSIENLTPRGILFLKNAKNMKIDLTSGILDVCDDQIGDTTLVIKSNFFQGKSVILPCISEVDEYLRDYKINVDLVIYEQAIGFEDIAAHILFCEMSKSDKLFFDKKWSVIMSQGLYASEGYLMDIGDRPSKVEDLLMNSILAYGEIFDREFYKTANWHLSGRYGLCQLEPSILINSFTVLMAAVEANLGVGPVVDCHKKLGYKKLVRVLPEIKGPDIVVDFAIRKKISDKFTKSINSIESKILNKLEECGLEIIY